MQELKLEQLIYQVKKEILEAQEKHEGEKGYFQLERVDLEIALATTYGGDGKVNLAVVEIGSDIAKEHTHTIRLSFSVVPQGGETTLVKLGGAYVDNTPGDEGVPG